MIKFFRKIRRNLLSEGKIGKYLKYAIGEIMLVVIGILIAIQLNTYKESYQLKSLKNEYYNQLKDDLTKDKQLLEENISKIDSLKTNYKEYIKTFEGEDLTVDQMIENLGKLDHRPNLFSFNSSTFESLEKSGEIKFIPEEIRNKLLDLNRSQKLLEEQINGNAMLQVDFLKEFWLAGGRPDLLNRINRNPKILDFLSVEINTPKAILALEANIGLKLDTEKSEVFKELISEIDKLIELIEIDQIK